MKTKMSVEWKTGRPRQNGVYVVICKPGHVSQIQFTEIYGWNTSGEDNHDYAFPDSDIIAWTEPFCNYVIDILRHRGIIKEKEVDNGERVQCD